MARKPFLIISDQPNDNTRGLLYQDTVHKALFQLSTLVNRLMNLVPTHNAVCKCLNYLDRKTFIKCFWDGTNHCHCFDHFPVEIVNSNFGRVGWWISNKIFCFHLCSEILILEDQFLSPKCMSYKWGGIGKSWRTKYILPQPKIVCKPFIFQNTYFWSLSVPKIIHLALKTNILRFIRNEICLSICLSVIHLSQ